MSRFDDVIVELDDAVQHDDAVRSNDAVQPGEPVEPFAANWGERRLVARAVVPPVPLTMTHRRRGVLRTRVTASLEAVVVDVSFVGAQVEAPYSREVAARTMVEVDLAGDRGTALVRNVHRHDGDLARYGIEFVDMTPAFQTRLGALLDRARAEQRRSASDDEASCSAERGRPRASCSNGTEESRSSTSRTW